MHLVAVNDQVCDGNLGIGPVHRNSKPVATASRSVAALKRLLNVMDIIVQQLNMRSGPHNAYAQWSEPMLSRAEVANFKAFDSHVALIVDGKHAFPSRGRIMRSDNCSCFAVGASE